MSKETKSNYMNFIEEIRKLDLTSDQRIKLIDLGCELSTSQYRKGSDDTFNNLRK